MANTSLGFTLPVTGTLSGTWGDTVNNEITTLIDTAIAGTYAVTVDTDYTLTTTVSATSDSRNAILRFTGARTALRTVTAPAQSKIYVVQNQTTGGFGVKLVGAGPTTGITILSGEEAVVAWNGSDFVRISTIGGPTEALSMNGGQLAGLRNKVTNGAMTVWQASSGGAVSLVAATSANSAYGIVDRYGVSSSGATTPVVSVVTAAGTGSYAQATTVSYVSGTAGGMGLFQRIEAINCADLVSKTVTFQAELSGATSQTVNWEVYYANTKDTWAVTGGSPTTGATLISSGTFSTTTTPTIYSASFSAGANAGNGLMIVVRTTANTGLTMVTSGWQLEIGSVATPFEHRPYTLELHLCGSLSSTGLGFTRGITVTDTNGSQLAGFRNKIINGNMGVIQRGTASVTLNGVASPTVVNGFGPTDRFRADTVGVGQNVVVSLGTFTTTDELYATGGAVNYAQYAVTSAANAVNYTTVLQAIENVSTLVGQYATLSFWAKAAAGTPTISVNLAQNFGAGGSAAVPNTAQTLTLSTTWTKYTKTFYIPSISGKTLGTNGLLVLTFYLDAGASVTAAGGIGQASKTVSLAQVQLEPGTIATPFEFRLPAVELVLCQRYFEVLPQAGSGSIQASFGAGMATTTTNATTMITFKVTKRVPPALTSSGSGSTFRVYAANGTDLTVTNLAYIGLGLETAVVNATVASGLVAGNATLLGRQTDTSAQIEINSEY